MPMRRKREAVTITIPNGAVPNVNYEPASLYKPDRDYRYVIGVWAKVMNLANQTGINLQLRDSAGNLVIDPSDSELWRGGSGMPPEEMFVPVLLPITGAAITPGARAQGPANVNADIIVQIVFLLSDEQIVVEDAVNPEK